MKRKFEQWNSCDPKAMAQQSEAAIRSAFEDAKEDILKMAEALRNIGYPKRGSLESDWDQYDIGRYVESNFDRDDLGA
jgi:hypothetical protein